MHDLEKFLNFSKLSEQLGQAEKISDKEGDTILSDFSDISSVMASCMEFQGFDKTIKLSEYFVL